ncbi:MAG: tyrosine-type recombinase/integrase [Acidobacteria bacterium]|nr:tyrosine-type recombinase/integrase [Acidobacteriota bacterium]
MALYRRGRIWYADYYAQGKRVQESTGTTNRREAEKFVALRSSEVQRGVYVKPTQISLDDFGERYLSHAKLHKRSWLRDGQMWRHLRDFFGDVNLGSITPLGIEAYQQHRVRSVSSSTVNRELALLKHMFNLAERWQFHQGANPVRLVPFLREDNLKFRTLSEAEERKLLSCSPPYLREMVVFAINTGLRSGEIFRLTWEEIDLDLKRIQPIIRKTRRPLAVPLNEMAYEVLVGRHAVKHGPYAFYNPATGDRFKDCKLGLKGALRRAGLTGITWHTFRHTFASRLTRSGVDLITVKELLGHSTITVTMRYAHSNEETKRAAVGRLPTSDKVVTVISRGRKNADYA